ncbi:aconitase family protein [Talaromyces proteolyticus]|uniref:Aconitase family protein n=1 Tax=Talaromyces proteolyticus TaxID=1131652 RepID=A0AAD4PZD1_9EURO|nr:aconitase family protein [Talaromyces proteolyticus]KAH8698906.1 aconitase family protein [Talaromyces proteolyticus]
MANILENLSERISATLMASRGITVIEQKAEHGENAENGNFVTVLDKFINILFNQGKIREADAITRAKDIALESKNLGGLDLDVWKPLDPSSCDAIVFWVEAWLQSLSSAERSRKLPHPVIERQATRRGMTLTEKILAHHTIGPIAPAGLKPGDFVHVAVDWIAASEISYFSMSKTLSELKSFKVWRNDRFWLAGDHVVDPRTYTTPLNRQLIKAMHEAAQEFRLTDYKGPNYTIMHTEFVRERAEPGMITIGADSHTCSSGAVGCLAIGLGAADVAMGLITGETWFKVPECISIRFIGQPNLGIGGKDVILYILGELKRNTVAAERIVEFSGPGCRHLSVDARFAIANMCTEFGAVTGIFVPDSLVKSYIEGRKQKHRRSSSIYFRPDADAQYAEMFEIDLSKVKPLFALYPSPDNVVPVTSQVGMHLDGCFIGACTTTEEDLILAALVLDVGLSKNFTLAPGRRNVTPGSIPIRSRLEALGLLDIYRAAGFSIGVPGCSYCVGMGADQAKAGEVWLSSQNRNFQHRMGKDSIGNLSSAATVAASSFSMTVTDPSSFLVEIDENYFQALLRRPCMAKELRKEAQLADVPYVEPNFDILSGKNGDETIKANYSKSATEELQEGSKRGCIRSKVITLGDFVDTDAIAPADCLVTAATDEELGSHCMKYVMPAFRDKVRNGQRVVVAGKALGVGSSREAAVRALKGLGIECIIARSFAFIFNRNLPNVGILRFTLDDDSFYEIAQDGVDIEIDQDERKVRVGDLEFSFQLSEMELALIVNEGMTKAYQRFGGEIFQQLAGEKPIDLNVNNIEPWEDLQW